MMALIIAGLNSRYVELSTHQTEKSPAAAQHFDIGTAQTGNAGHVNDFHNGKDP